MQPFIFPYIEENVVLIPYFVNGGMVINVSYERGISRAENYDEMIKPRLIQVLIFEE